MGCLVRPPLNLIGPDCPPSIPLDSSKDSLEIHLGRHFEGNDGNTSCLQAFQSIPKEAINILKGFVMPLKAVLPNGLGQTACFTKGARLSKDSRFAEWAQ